LLDLRLDDSDNVSFDLAQPRRFASVECMDDVLGCDVDLVDGAE
jgi:hypothetical protein